MEPKYHYDLPPSNSPHLNSYTDFSYHPPNKDCDLHNTLPDGY